MATKKLKLEEEEISEILVASLSRRQTTGCNKWRRITILGTASRKEHKCSSFRQSSKRCEKK
jgi:hypothetical protein